MGRGGGGSSGGSSFGGSSGRSFGGRSSSGHSRGGGSSSTSHSSFSGGGFRSGRYYGGYYGRGSTFGSILGVVLFLIVLATSILPNIVGSGKATRSTIERHPLKANQAFNRDCYSDEMSGGWIYNSSTLVHGMEKFYKETGVQPLLALTDNMNGSTRPTISEAEEWCTQKYQELSNGNEMCVLLVFAEWSDSNYNVYYIVGEQAQAVMDTEACDILMDYVDAYYTSDMSDEQYFSEVFVSTAERIMKVSPTAFNYVVIVAIVLVVIIIGVTVFGVVRMKIRRAKEEAEETERILNTDIEHL